MHIRLTRGRFDPGKADEFLRLARESTLPKARQLPGFKRMQIGVDRGAGRFVAVTAFDTAEQSQAMSTLRAQHEAAGVQFEAPEAYEVVIES